MRFSLISAIATLCSVVIAQPVAQWAPPSLPEIQSIFLRFARDSPFANNDTFAIRKEVQFLLRLASTDIPGCHKVPSGFALVPKDDAVRQTILAHKDRIGARFGCIQIEVPKKWVTYAVQNVPMTMRLGTAPLDTTTAIKDEVLVQAGQEP
ncbi:hypothetical protein N0V85_008705, partial [Neurospora sp. IMI 360204]